MPVEFQKDRFLYDIGEVSGMSNAPQPYIIQHLIFKGGKTVIVGKPKMGKSWLVMKLGISIGQGIPILNLQTNQYNVLYIEFDRRSLINSINTIASDGLWGSFYIYKASVVALNTEEGLNFLDGLIQLMVKEKKAMPNLIIIDHKSACFSGKEADDDSNRKWIQNLDIIAERYSVAYLVVCQAPKGFKGELEDIVDLPFGSRILTAWADTVISIKKKGNKYRQLEIASNYSDLESIVYDKEFHIVIEAETTKVDVVQELLLAQWSEMKPGQVSARIEAISKEAKCSYKTTWDAYKIIKEEKKLEKIQKEQDRKIMPEGQENA